MTTMLEKAARALATLQGANWDARSSLETLGGEEPEEMRDGFFDQVRAVLMAVRGDQIELNEGIGDVYRSGFEAMFDAKFKDEYPMMSCGWEAMIDAILNEKDTTND